MDEAENIFDHLPMRKSEAEESYISHLWNAFVTLREQATDGRQFSILHFHLLFMLSLQNIVMRISSHYNKDYNMAFIIEGGRDKTKISSPKSVYDIALLNESSIPDLLKIINCDDKVIKRIKDLVRFRNDNLAHAKGGIDSDPDAKISEYIETLLLVRERIIILNDNICDSWESEMDPDEDLNNFIEQRLLEYRLCTADFRSGNLKTKFSTVFGLDEDTD